MAAVLEAPPLAEVRTDPKHVRMVRFLIVGGLSTVAYLALYALLRTQLDSQLANAIALLVTGDLNTVANRRWTFGHTGRIPHHHRVKGVAAYLVSLVATSGSLAALDVLGAQGQVAELTALLIANLAAGVVHYVLLESWAFRVRDPAKDQA